MRWTVFVAMAFITVIWGLRPAEADTVRFEIRRGGSVAPEIAALRMKEEIGNLPTQAATDELYAGTGYKLAPAGYNVHGYIVGNNVATCKMNCGGLAFASLLDGEFNVPTDQALAVVRALGSPVRAERRRWDLVLWRSRETGGAAHWALIIETSPEVMVASKEGTEPIMIGPLSSFPAAKKQYDPTPEVWRLEWNDVTARRKGDPEMTDDAAFEAAMARARAALKERKRLSDERDALQTEMTTKAKKAEAKLAELTKALAAAKGSGLSGEQMQSFADALGDAAEKAKESMTPLEQAYDGLIQLAESTEVEADRMEALAAEFGKLAEAARKEKTARAAETVSMVQREYESAMALIETRKGPGKRLQTDTGLFVTRMKRADALYYDTWRIYADGRAAYSDHQVAFPRAGELAKQMDAKRAEAMEALRPFRMRVPAGRLYDEAMRLDPAPAPPSCAFDDKAALADLTRWNTLLEPGPRVLGRASETLRAFQDLETAGDVSMMSALRPLLRLLEAYSKLLGGGNDTDLERVRALLRLAHACDGSVQALLNAARSRIEAADDDIDTATDLRERIAPDLSAADGISTVMSQLQFDVTEMGERGKELSLLLDSLRQESSQCAAWTRQIEGWIAQAPGATPDQVRGWQDGALRLVGEAHSRIDADSGEAEKMHASLSTAAARDRLRRVEEARHAAKTLPSAARDLLDIASRITACANDVKQAKSEAQSAIKEVRKYAQEALKLLAPARGDEVEGLREEAESLLEAAAEDEAFDEDAHLSGQAGETRSAADSIERKADELARELSDFDAVFSEKPILELEQLRGEVPSIVLGVRAALTALDSAYGRLMNVRMTDAAKTVQVPNVVGKSIKEALSLLPPTLVPDPVVAREAPKDPAQANRVIDQNPPAGATVPVGSKIVLTINPAPAEALVVVPPFVGMKAKAAKAAAPDGLGVVFDVAGDPPRRKEDVDRVLSQSRDPGDRVPRGTVVSLLIYGPIEEVTLPNAVGMKVDAARAAFPPGIVVSTEEAIKPSTNPDLAGLVIRQSPPGGSRVEKHSAVVLTYNPAPRKESGPVVPDFVGMKIRDAMASVPEGLSVVPSVAKDPPRHAEDAGRVISQDPDPGSRVPAGTVVTLLINGPPKGGDTVPYVCGMKLDDAVAALNAVGMSVTTSCLGKPDHKEQAGTVHGQDPDSGLSIPENKAATLSYWGEYKESAGGPPADPKQPDPGPGAASLVDTEWEATSTILDCVQKDRIGETKETSILIHRPGGGQLVVWVGAFYTFVPTQQTGEGGELSGKGGDGSGSCVVFASFTFEGDAGTGVASVFDEHDDQATTFNMKLSYKLRRKK